MKQSIRKYLSLFLLGAFLFAYTEKSVHDILHSDDAHCHSLTEKHFHNIEHHCAICDFEFPWFDKSVTCTKVSFLPKTNDLTFILPASSLLVKEVSLYSSRAPPAIV